MAGIRRLLEDGLCGLRDGRMSTSTHPATAAAALLGRVAAAGKEGLSGPLDRDPHAEIRGPVHGAWRRLAEMAEAGHADLDGAREPTGGRWASCAFDDVAVAMTIVEEHGNRILGLWPTGPGRHGPEALPAFGRTHDAALRASGDQTVNGTVGIRGGTEGWRAFARALADLAAVLPIRPRGFSLTTATAEAWPRLAPRYADGAERGGDGNGMGDGDYAPLLAHLAMSRMPSASCLYRTGTGGGIEMRGHHVLIATPQPDSAALRAAAARRRGEACRRLYEAMRDDGAPDRALEPLRTGMRG